MKNEIILFDNQDIKLDVNIKDETVWLNQNQMAELFNVDRTGVSRHINNIYKEEELEKNITCAKFAHMGIDNDQAYEKEYYNLDVIISVGYRVKSKNGVIFRKWANKVLKEYTKDNNIWSYYLNGININGEQFLLEFDVVSMKNGENHYRVQRLQKKTDVSAGSFAISKTVPTLETSIIDNNIPQSDTNVKLPIATTNSTMQNTKNNSVNFPINENLKANKTMNPSEISKIDL